MRTIRAFAFSMARRMSAAAVLFLSTSQPFPAVAEAVFVPPHVTVAPIGGARVTGQVMGLTGSELQLRLRSGRSVSVNIRTAEAHGNMPMIYKGEFLQIQGSMAGHGSMTAASVIRAKSAPAAWSPDIP
jgi:hypothetical protein